MGDYSTTDYMLDLLMLVFLGIGFLFITASSQKKRQSSKQISIPIAFLDDSVKLYSNFSLSHGTTKLS